MCQGTVGKAVKKKAVAEARALGRGGHSGYRRVCAPSIGHAVGDADMQRDRWMRHGASVSPWRSSTYRPRWIFFLISRSMPPAKRRGRFCAKPWQRAPKAAASRRELASFFSDANRRSPSAFAVGMLRRRKGKKASGARGMCAACVLCSSEPAMAYADARITLLDGWEVDDELGNAGTVPA